MEWPLSLCPPSSFSLRWIHAFKGTFELLEAAFLGKFSGYIHLLRDFNLLADDGIQIRDMIVHHLAVLEPLSDKYFESLNGWPLQECCRWSDNDERMIGV
jgi:hypothetical protein